VCGETKPITEVRDYGYLTKGINELKDKIKQQSKEVAKHMLTQEPIMTDDELDGVMMASYEEGELTCKFTEAELIALAEVLNAHEEEHPITPPPELVREWQREANHNEAMFPQVAAQAARWGYQQAIEELETFLRKGNDAN